VKGRTTDIGKIADAIVDFDGASGLCGTIGKSGGKTGSDGDGLSVSVVDGDPDQVLALAVALHNVIQGTVIGAPGRRFEAFLEVFGKNGRAMREIVAKIAALGAHLIDGVDGRNAEHAYSERENEFEGGTHKVFIRKTRESKHGVSTSDETKQALWRVSRPANQEGQLNARKPVRDGVARRS